jgi:short-subunit dehydrogenase
MNWDFPDFGKNMNEITRGTAVITGASRGIGREFAVILAENGYDLVLTARDREKLASLADELKDAFGTRSEVIISDLSEEGAAGTISRAISEKGIVADILINNAGFGLYGNFSGNDGRKLSRMINCNITSPTLLTRALLPGMLERGRGMILNVASTASFRAGPLTAVYSASKAYLLSFSRALSSELRNTGVTVTALCPGPVDTGFDESAGMKRSGLAGTRKVPPARKVALFGYRSMIRGKPIAVHGFANKLIVFASRILPSAILDDLSKRARGKE